ncbi:aspartate aminotransferase family protein [Streptomyces zhihengii]|uniref:aspartate aminotransferase family protein n=1 Tax=Streptomyces zhihengii TaxID=1818004 RepID=UPI0036B67B3F
MSTAHSPLNGTAPHLVGGVAAGWNSLSAVGPVRVTGASGPYIRDDQGRELLDFIMGWGSCFLGHDAPPIREALQKALSGGFLYQYETATHGMLAEEFCAVVPCADKLRLANSGLEATMYALRIARAVTGRRLVVKFEGHFHGLNDQLMWNVDTSEGPAAPGENGVLQRLPGAPGLPDEFGELVLPLPWNAPGLVDQVFAEHGDDIAAVILEPVCLNIGCVGPEPGFLEHLRAITTRHDALLIFDEVLTGFRLALGGAQERFGVVPDLACYGKAFGCGMPIAGIAGRADFMDAVAPVGQVEVSGTNTGRYLSVVGALAALRELSTPGFYEHIEQLNDHLVTGVREVLGQHGVPAFVSGFGGRVGVHIGSSERPRNMADVARLYNLPYATELFRLLSTKFDLYGFLLPLSFCPEPVTVSAAHTTGHIDEALSRLDDALTELPYKPHEPDGPLLGGGRGWR